MAWRGHGRGVLRGARREEKERDQIPRGREAGGGRAGEFYQPQRLLARLWRRLHGKKERKISDGFASLELSSDNVSPTPAESAVRRAQAECVCGCGVCTGITVYFICPSRHR